MSMPVEDAPTRVQGTAVVIGGGAMGAGIAQVLLEAGTDVFVLESDEAAAARCSERVESGLMRRFKDADRVSEHMRRFSTDVEPSDSAEPSLVIEAVPEIEALKVEVLRRAESRFPTALLLASNTSSLSITALSEALRQPSRFIGMHFFNPVPTSNLIEIVTGKQTGSDAIVLAARWADHIGREAITVRDSPGFATSRLGVAIGLEAATSSLSVRFG
jgi:3-hydroxybutyryl-CoA dehydrogenase